MLDELLKERAQMLGMVRDEIGSYRALLATLQEFEQELLSQVKQLSAVKAKDQEPKFAEMLQKYKKVLAEKVRAHEQEKRPRAIRDSAYQILKRSPEPVWVHYSELMKQVEAMGVQIGGQRPDDNFMNHLSQDERFIRRNGRAVWSLREWFPRLESHAEAKQNGVNATN